MTETVPRLDVLFLSQIVPYPPHGGVLQRGFNVIRELGRRCNVHLLAFVHPDALPDANTLEASRAALGPWCRTIEYFPLWVKTSRLALGAALAASACSPATPFSVVAHRSDAYRRRVQEMMRAHRFDLVHVDTIALSQFVDPAGPVPTALTHHNIESQLMSRRASVEPRWYARRFLAREATKLKQLETAASPRFGINIVMSPQDGNILRQMAPDVRLAVVPNGVDTGYFQPDGGEAEIPALIYAGGMNMFANRDAVMHFLGSVWPAIRQQIPGVRFFAVGQDPPAELRDMAGEDSGIDVTGYVSDIRPYARQAAVYVVPLRVGGGTRLKVLDAMALGKALVSTSIGCEGLDVTPGEHLLVADTPEDFASSVVSLLRDPARRRQLGAAARRLVMERYAWEIVGDRLLDAYDQAVAARGAGR